MNRAVAVKRMEAEDSGVVLRHGTGPSGCDRHGAREALVFTDGKHFYLHYDGMGLDGWAACLAVSDDLVRWEKCGRALNPGAPGMRDSAAACSPWLYFEGGIWHMFYFGTANASPAPDFVPLYPYMTLKARSTSPRGPWEKQYDVVPFLPKEGTYYSDTASPGAVIERDDEYLQFFSSACLSKEGNALRTVSLARTKNLDGSWIVADEPILPVTEQIENVSLYFEEVNGLWFLFTNHVSLSENGEEYTSAVWVYWSDNLFSWKPANKAVVLDKQNCLWSPLLIGMPAVLPVNGRLAIFYDGCAENKIEHMRRDIGLAWLDLPLHPPA